MCSISVVYAGVDIPLCVRLPPLNMPQQSHDDAEESVSSTPVLLYCTRINYMLRSVPRLHQKHFQASLSPDRMDAFPWRVFVDKMVSSRVNFHPPAVS